MTIRTKNLLTLSIIEYEVSKQEKKDRLIEHLENEIERHLHSLKHTGMGLDSDMVQGGYIFLRIFHPKSKVFGKRPL